MGAFYSVAVSGGLDCKTGGRMDNLEHVRDDEKANLTAANVRMFKVCHAPWSGEGGEPHNQLPERKVGGPSRRQEHTTIARTAPIAQGLGRLRR